MLKLSVLPEAIVAGKALAIGTIVLYIAVVVGCIIWVIYFAKYRHRRARRRKSRRRDPKE